MGMFDQEIPQELTPLQEIQMAAGRMAERTAPFLKESIGYESPEREMRRVASETDLSNSDAVQKTFNFLMSKNPTAAANWLKSVKPTIDYHIAQQSAKAKTAEAPKTIRVGVPNDPTKVMTMEFVNGNWRPILDPLTNKPLVEDKYQKQAFAGSIPQGYRLNEKNELEVIPGGPQADAAEKAKNMKEIADNDTKNKAARVINIGQDIRNIIKEADKDKTSFIFGPVGVAQGYIPGTRRADVEAAVNSLYARIGFDELAAMRAASPTGGALGQVSELELKQLNAALGSLDLSQSREQFLKNLKRVETQYQAIINKIIETGDGTYVPPNYNPNPLNI